MKIGVIGVGAMGLPIALRLHDLGHKVFVRDLLAGREALAAGCTVARSAATLADQVELVIVAVVDGVQTQDVLFGPAGVVRAGRRPQAVLLCPTIAAADTEACARQLEALGIDALDAPMSGGPARAREGSMSLMVACRGEVFERWRPLLQQMASRLFHVGTRPGDGARTKLINNLLAAVNLAAMGEAMALAERLGLDLAGTLAVIEQSSGHSWIGSERMQRALAGEPGVMAQIALLAKDSALALQLAADAGASVPVGAVAAERFAQAVQAGWAQQDDAQLWRLNAQRP